MQGRRRIEELLLPTDPRQLEVMILRSFPARCQVNLCGCRRPDEIRLIDCSGVTLLQLPADLMQIDALELRDLPAHCSIDPDTRAALLGYARHHPGSIQLHGSPTIPADTDSRANAAS